MSRDSRMPIPAAPGPLAGLRVLDLSRVLAGPWCTQSLADLGADVLKVERPGTGDETRTWGPPEMGGMAAYFTCANRSKRSLALDLDLPEDVDRLFALATVADVIVENFKLGTLERHGLGYEQVRAVNPGVIYCSISGYGRTGPDAGRAGYDFVIQAETGLMSITGSPEGGPTKVGVAISDLVSGLYASQAILAALVGRQASGRGQHLDVALFDCQLAALANVAANALATGKTPVRYGNAHPNVVPYEVFEAADGPFVVAIGNDGQFGRLCTMVLERPQLATDPRFATNSARSLNRDALREILSSMFSRRGSAEWISRLGEFNLPSGLIQGVDNAIRSNHVRARQQLAEVTDDRGTVKMIRYPVRLSAGLPEPRMPPLVGEGGLAAAASWLAHAAQPSAPQNFGEDA